MLIHFYSLIKNIHKIKIKKIKIPQKRYKSENPIKYPLNCKIVSVLNVIKSILYFA